MLLQGTLGDDFDIFAASGESTAWVLLWKTRSRLVGVRVCPVAQFNFFSTAFDPRVWTMVVFWKEDSGRQPQLISPENEGGAETSFPSPPNFTFFDDLDVPLGPGPRGPPAPRGPPGPSGAPSPATERQREKVRARNSSRERLHPRSPSREPQLIPIPMSDGEDDQPPQDGRQRQRSRSRDRAQQVPQIQPKVIQEPDTASDEDSAVVNHSSSTSASTASSYSRHG